jgi:hypothetical protein
MSEKLAMDSPQSVPFPTVRTSFLCRRMDETSSKPCDE